MADDRQTDQEPERQAENLTAREHAERRLTGGRYSGRQLPSSVAVTDAAARIGWALLDIADAIREHAEATRPQPSGPAFRNRGTR